MASKQGSRIVQIDFLRGIAILLVLGQHLRVSPGNMPPGSAGSLHLIATFFYVSGWTGVDLFFVLSGFLIGGLLFAEIRQHGNLNVGRFLIRRGFKIWPLYYLYLLFVIPIIAFYMQKPASYVAQNMWGPFANIQNYYGITVPEYNTLAHTWSLAVEEHFYLFLPVLLLLLLRTTRNPAKSIPALPFVAVAVMIYSLTMRLQLAADDHNYLCPTHLRMDSLFFGVLLAYIWHYHRERLDPWLKRPALWIIGGFLILSPMLKRFHDDYFAHTLGYVCLYLGYGCLLIGAMATYTPPNGSDAPAGLLVAFFRTRLARAVAYIGFFSYPIYLFHMFPGKVPLAFMLAHFPAMQGSGAGWLLLVAVYIASAVAIGATLSKLVERPTLALRDRLFPAFASKAVVAGNAPAVQRAC